MSRDIVMGPGRDEIAVGAIDRAKREVHAAVGIRRAFFDIGSRLFVAAPWRSAAVAAIEPGEPARRPDGITMLERALVIAHAHFRRLDHLPEVAAALQFGK